MLDTPTSGSCSRKEAFDRHLIPEATRTYQPLPNKILVDMIHRIALESNVILTNEQLGMDLKGQRMFGVCDIEGKDFLGGDIQMMIGFCNSYNGTMATRFCIGGKVFVCSNSAFHAYTDEKTGVSGISIRPHWNYDNDKHEGLIVQIRAAFDQIEDFRHAQEGFYEGLLERKLSDNRAYAAIVRAAQAGVVNKTKVLTLADEWNRQALEPKDIDTCGYEWHEEFQQRNAYSLFNAFTQVEKDRLEKNPVQSNISTIDLSGFFCKEFKIK